MHSDFLKPKKEAGLRTIIRCFLWVNKGSFLFAKTQLQSEFYTIIRWSKTTTILITKRRMNIKVQLLSSLRNL